MSNVFEGASGVTCGNSEVSKICIDGNIVYSKEDSPNNNWNICITFVDNNGNPVTDELFTITDDYSGVRFLNDNTPDSEGKVYLDAPLSGYTNKSIYIDSSSWSNLNWYMLMQEPDSWKIFTYIQDRCVNVNSPSQEYVDGKIFVTLNVDSLK